MPSARPFMKPACAIAALMVAVFAVTALAAGLPKPAAEPSRASKEAGQDLAAQLRASRPTEDVDVQGAVRVRDGDGNRSRQPFHYRILTGSGSWHSVYEIRSPGGTAVERLEVVHHEDGSNEYRLSLSEGTNAVPAAPRILTGDRSMVPFAGSDFWLADLGLEFLRWPGQRIVEEVTIKMRKGRSCRVLESTNPAPGAQGYTRVRSWVDIETGGIVIAEAYGPDGKVLKEFEVGGVTKVNGRWELKNMEMRNAVTDSLTVFEFKYEKKAD